MEGRGFVSSGGVVSQEDPEEDRGLVMQGLVSHGKEPGIFLRVVQCHENPHLISQGQSPLISLRQEPSVQVGAQPAFVKPHHARWILYYCWLLSKLKNRAEQLPQRLRGSKA